jgi:Zn-dependent protease
MPIDILFFVAILLMSVVIHEVAHGQAAFLLGDRTAHNAGRLTLNPLPHLDMVGSIIVPLILILSQSGFLIGWAKPVPYNPYNLRNQRWGTLIVGLAGVFMNFALALVFGLIIRFSGGGLETIVGSTVLRAAVLITGLNLVLGVFNLIPVPPLDGSKVLFSLLPYHLRYIENFIQQYYIMFLVLVFFFGGMIVVPVVDTLFTLITGFPLGLYGVVLPF